MYQLLKLFFRKIHLSKLQAILFVLEHGFKDEYTYDQSSENVSHIWRPQRFLI